MRGGSFLRRPIQALVWVLLLATAGGYVLLTLASAADTAITNTNATTTTATNATTVTATPPSTEVPAATTGGGNCSASASPTTTTGGAGGEGGAVPSSSSSNNVVATSDGGPSGGEKEASTPVQPEQSCSSSSSSSTSSCTPPANQPPPPGSRTNTTPSTSTSTTTPPTPPPDKKTKTQHEVNYAAATAGALILENAPGLVGTSNLLDDNKDKYTRSPCNEPKWVVINLSEDIQVQSIVLANYEKFSSMVKDFEVLYSVKRPREDDEWKELGKFTAKEKGGEQRFELANPVYARYLLFRFLTHYGNEFYCTLSQIKVHGFTLQQGFLNDWAQTKKTLGEFQEKVGTNDEGETLPNQEQVEKEAPVVSAINQTGPTVTTAETPEEREGQDAKKVNHTVLPDSQPAQPSPPQQQLPSSSSSSNTSIEGTGNPEVVVDEVSEGRGATAPVSITTTSSATTTTTQSKATMEVQATEAVSSGDAVPPSPEAGEETDKVVQPASEELVEEELGGTLELIVEEEDDEELPSDLDEEESDQEEDKLEEELEEDEDEELDEFDIDDDEDEVEVIITSEDIAASGGMQAPPVAKPAPIEGSPSSTTDKVAESIKNESRKSEPNSSLAAAVGAAAAMVKTALSNVSTSKIITSTTTTTASEVATASIASSSSTSSSDSKDVPVSESDRECKTAAATETTVRSSPPKEATEDQVGSSSTASSSSTTSSPSSGGASAPSTSASSVNASSSVSTSSSTSSESSPPSPPVGSSKAGAEEAATSIVNETAMESSSSTPSATTTSTTTTITTDTTTVEKQQSIDITISAPPAESAPPAQGASTSTNPPSIVASPNLQSQSSTSAARLRQRCVDLAEFRKQKLAKLKQEETKKGGGAAPGGAYDNIFQTLMSEVTTVELNQSILEAYVTHLQQCVVQVIDEVKLEQERERANLLATVEQLRSLMESASRMNADLKEEMRIMWDRVIICCMGLSLFSLILLWCARILRKTA